MDRVTIELRLATDRALLLARYAALPQEALARPLTPSEHDPATSWSALDHLAHLAYVEGRFAEIARAHLAGSTDPLGWRWPDGQPRSREELLTGFASLAEPWAQDLMASIHAELEAAVLAQRGRSFADVVALGQRVRAETLALLAELPDERLTEAIPGSPFSDGTVGGLLANSGPHSRRHVAWVAAALGRVGTQGGTP